MKEGDSTDGLLSIGRFSQMTRLSIKSLRLYAERGLLEPVYVDERNGYRYYHPSQAGRAEAIKGLRGAQMPLDQIAAVFEHNPVGAKVLLESHREELLDDAKRAEQSAAFLSDVISGRRTLMPYEIRSKTLPSIRVASVTKEVTLETIGEVMGPGWGEVMGAIMRSGNHPTGAPFTVYVDVIDEETHGRIELCIPTTDGFESDGDVTATTTEEVEAASTIHQGRYSDVGLAYHALMTWIESHGYEPAGPPHEIYLNDPNEVDEGDQLTEVAWPICKAE